MRASDTFESISGKGARGRVGDHEVAVGNVALLSKLGVDPKRLDARAETLRGDRQTVMLVVIDGRAAGLIGVADPIKASTPEALELLRAEGVRVVMSAGVTLVHGDLRGIARARRLSRGTMRNIRQNLFFAFVYNALGAPLAAGVLYPFTEWLLDPMFASAATSLSSVSVIANALRLRSVGI